MAMLNNQMVIGSYFNIFQLFWGWYSHRNHQRWCAKHQLAALENIWKYNQVGPTAGHFHPWFQAKNISSYPPFPGFALLSGTSIPYLFAMLVDFRGHGNIRGGFSTIKGVRSSWRQEVCSSEIEVVFHSTARGGSCITMDPQGAVPLMY